MLEAHGATYFPQLVELIGGIEAGDGDVLQGRAEGTGRW